MTRFNKLKFEEAHHGMMQATVEFDNKFGVSVVYGSAAACQYEFDANGEYIGTYEVAILFDGNISYANPIADDVIGWLDKEEVNQIIKQVEELKTSDEGTVTEWELLETDDDEPEWLKNTDDWSNENNT